MKPQRNIVLHDGTFDGMLTAVAYVVKGNHRPRGIYDRLLHTPQLFDHHQKPTKIVTDHDQAKRLFTFLRDQHNLASYYALNMYLSEDINGAQYLVEMVSKILQNGPSILECYTDETIRHLDSVSRKVRGEVHRLNGLIRFRKLREDILYAPLEPDFNVIGYCAKHFIGRLRNTRWILHDIQRDISVFWDMEKISAIQVDRKFTEHLYREGEILQERFDDEEWDYQELWRIFHRSIANVSRENRKLQRQRMPARYWKYLIEMDVE